MKRPTPAGLAAALFAVLAVLASSSALAYFSGSGTGDAKAAVSRLEPPTIAATPGSGGAVALSWTALTPPAGGAVKYELSRDGEAPGGDCPANPTALTACADSGLTLGNHTYVVTARWRSWSIASEPVTVKVALGAVTHFELTAATDSPAVGAADNLTIAAKDDNGNTVTTYAGNKSLTFSGASASPGGNAPTVANSGGTAIAFGKATTIGFTAGVAKVTSSKNGLMKIYRSGPASISVGDGNLEAEPPLQVDVVSGPAKKLSLATATTALTAGGPEDLTITAVDTYGNPAGEYDGPETLTFSGASASPAGNTPTVTDLAGAAVPFGAATEIEFDQGVASAAGGANGQMTLYKSGSTNVKATDGTLNSSTALAVTVATAEAPTLVLTGSTETPSAVGTSNLTTTVKDPYGNTVTTYTGSHDITFTGPLPSPGATPTVVNTSGTAVPFGSPTTLNFKNGVASVSSSKNGLMRLVLPGETSISAGDGAISTAAPLALNVLIGAASKWALTGVTASAGTIGSPCLFTCPVTGLGNGGRITASVSVTDASGNTVSDLGGGHAVKITSTSGGAIAGTPLTIAGAGPAVSTATFTYTAPASGNFTHTITAATSSGAGHSSATATASR